MDLYTFDDFAGNSAFDTEDKFGYTGGVSVALGPAFKLYLPLFDSPFMSDVYDIQDLTSFKDRIVFKLNLNTNSLLDLKSKIYSSKLFQ